MSRKLTYNPTASLVLVLLLVTCCALVTHFISLPQTSAPGGPPAGTGRDPITVFLASIAAIVSLWNAFIAHQYAARLEEFKQQLSSKFPALKETREAALSYYRTLAKLETQTFTEEELNRSEEVMTQAEGSTYFLDEDYQKAWYEFWYEFWQAARNIATKAKRASKADSQQGWRNDWAKKIAAELRKIAMYQS